MMDRLQKEVEFRWSDKWGVLGFSCACCACWGGSQGRTAEVFRWVASMGWISGANR
jgi:hypothetical protein